MVEKDHPRTQDLPMACDFVDSAKLCPAGLDYDYVFGPDFTLLETCGPKARVSQDYCQTLIERGRASARSLEGL